MDLCESVAGDYFDNLHGFILKIRPMNKETNVLHFIFVILNDKYYTFESYLILVINLALPLFTFIELSQLKTSLNRV